MLVKMEKFVMFIAAIMLMVMTAALGITYYELSPFFNGDGLAEWRENGGFHKYVVTYEGRKYYCDYVESIAGHPERLILYRGKDHLLLPDKYSVEKRRAFPNAGFIKK